MPGDGSSCAYQLKVTLLQSRPPIWRRLLVPAEVNLGDLHTIVQVSMGWDSVGWDYHLHQFQVDGVSYGNPDHWDGWGPRVDDERRARLWDVAGVGSRLKYWYDFGDDWWHELKVEKVTDDPSALAGPTCLDGRRACPPEDCGGIYGYEELLRILADPTDPQHEEMAEWAGVDPEAFDVIEVNGRLEGLNHKPGRSGARLTARR